MCAWDLVVAHKYFKLDSCRLILKVQKVNRFIKVFIFTFVRLSYFLCRISRIALCINLNLFFNVENKNCYLKFNW